MKLVLSKAMGCAVAWLGGLATVLCGFWVQAQTVDVSLLGRWPDAVLGRVHGILSLGDYAYCFTDSGFQVFDLSTPAQPMHVGGLSLGPMLVSGRYAYVLSPRELEIVSLENPLQPVRVGGLPGLAARSLWVTNNLAYVLGWGNDGRSGLHIVDVSDPANPVPLGATEMVPHFQIRVWGNHAYLAGYDFKVVDVSNPAAPVETASVFLTNQLKQPTRLNSLEVARGYAYIAATSGRDFVEFSDLLILDLGDPSKPVVVAAVPEVGGNVVVLAEPYAFVCGFSGFSVVDISQPTSPTVVSTYRARFPAMTSLALWGRHVILGGTRAIEVVEVSDLKAPVLVGYFLSGASDVWAVAPAGQLAYVADGSYGLQVLDLSQVDRPRRLGGHYEFAGTPIDVAVSGAYAYVLEWPNRLKVFDLSQPARPVPVGGVAVPHPARRVAVAGEYAYVAQDRPGAMEFVEGVGLQIRENAVGLTVVDVRDAAQPSTRGGFFFSKGRASSQIYGLNLRYVEDVEVRGQYAYLSWRGFYTTYLGNDYFGFAPMGGLEVIDVGDPDRPVSVGGDFSDTAFHFGLAVGGGAAQVAWGWRGMVSWDQWRSRGGLRSYRLSDPAQPVLVGSYAGPTIESQLGQVVPAYDVGVYGNWAYLTGTSPSFGVLDLSSETNAVLVGSYDGVGSRARVVVYGPYALVADRYEGLKILSVRPRLLWERAEAGLRLRWTAGASEFVLERSGAVGGGAWAAVEGSAAVREGFYEVEVPLDQEGTFYRLRAR